MSETGPGTALAILPRAHNTGGCGGLTLDMHPTRIQTAPHEPDTPPILYLSTTANDVAAR